jgi:hypothetical protein
MKQFEAASAAALREVVPEIERILIVTVGTRYYSLQALAMMHHPYAATHPNPPMPPGVINKQSGRFFESFVVTAPTKIKSTIVLSVYSMDQERFEQLYMSAYMIPRTYIELLRSRMNARIKRLLGDALRGNIKVMVRG